MQLKASLTTGTSSSPTEWGLGMCSGFGVEGFGFIGFRV